jgi:hypothetical protein
LRTTATVWDESIRFVDRVRPQLRHFHEVRYEDVLQNPVAQLDAIFAFCGLAEPRGDAYRAQIAQVGVIQHENRYSGFDVVESIAGDSLRRHGYR